MTTVGTPRSNGGAAGPSLDWEGLRKRFSASGDASRVLAGRSEMVDRLVVSAYGETIAPVQAKGIAVLAIGGYGRRELFPHSDVDLLVLAEKQPAGASRAALSTFQRILWDAQLRLSHSVRTPKECAELHDQNIELNISLLDQRFLTGDRALYDQMEERLPRFLNSQRERLTSHLCRLTRPRHAKYQNTIYHLEPNVKETPGGLRDLHVLGWLYRLRKDPLVASHWLDGLAGSRSFLASLRCFLHFRAGRDDNALSFDAQEEIAEQPFLPFNDPAAWMREYFFHAREIHRAAVRAMELSEGRNSSMLRGFLQWRSRLSNAEFSVSQERVYFRAPQSIPHDPELVLRLFDFVGRHGFRLSLETERKIRESLPILERHFASQRPHWGSILEILSRSHVARALEAMHETGVLAAVFPEWKRIECLVTRDFYHRYTVDEHTIQAIRNLEALSGAEDPGHSRFAGLLEEVEQPDVLRLAMLFHDMGKGGGTGSHAEVSVQLAEQAMERILLPLGKRAMVRFLIERHLDLSSVMTSRDLDDPLTASYVAGRVETVEKLKSLVLLTYADICAVNPTAMTPWRLEQLWIVYLKTYNELTRHLESDRIVAERSSSPERNAFIEGFPSRYLRTHSDEEVTRHMHLEKRSRERGVGIEIEKRNGVYVLEIVARDRPFLLASIAGALAAFGMNILKAEAFSNKQGTVLDTFAFEDPSRTLELNPTELDRLVLTLERVTLERQRARDLLKNRKAAAPPSKGSRIEPRVRFDGSASETATLVEIVAEDRPGLLYDLTRRISEAEANIEVVLIDTEAHKAVDVFYVTKDGRKLNPAEEESLHESLLEAARPAR